MLDTTDACMLSAFFAIIVPTSLCFCVHFMQEKEQIVNLDDMPEAVNIFFVSLFKNILHCCFGCSDGDSVYSSKYVSVKPGLCCVLLQRYSAFTSLSGRY